jgi:TRAP-type C4-dicarboxylate transport system substrate-binding protein
MKKCAILCAFLFVISVGFSGLAHAKGPIVLKMATFLPRNDKNMTAWWGLIKDINKRAEGKLKIKYVGGPESVKGFKQFDALRKGVLDMIFGCESYYGRQVSGAPYTHLTRLTAQEERKNGYYEFRVNLLKKHNVMYLGRAETNVWFNIFTNKKVQHPKELKGQKIRVSGTYQPFVKKLGAVPQQIGYSEIYTALERGTIDGYAWAIIGNMSAGWNEVCKYIVEPRIYQMNIEALMNLKTWNKLPKNLQKLIMDCMIRNEKEFGKVMKGVAESEYKALQKKGMKVISFTPAETKWYQDTAYQAGWDEVFKYAPKLGPKLKKLLSH